MKKSILTVISFFISLNSFSQAPAIQWAKCLGGTQNDEARSIGRTTDAGYIVAGSSYSNDGNVTNNHGVWDFWVVKIDNSGSIQWQKCLGGSLSDYLYS